MIDLATDRNPVRPSGRVHASRAAPLLLALLAGCSMFSGGPPEKVRELDWLAGQWEGELDGDRVQMTWTMPSNGMMEGRQETWRDGSLALTTSMRILGGVDGMTLYGSPHGATDRTYGLVDGSRQKIRFLGRRAEFPAEGTFTRSGSTLTVMFRGLDDVGDMRVVTYEYRRVND